MIRAEPIRLDSRFGHAPTARPPTALTEKTRPTMDDEACSSRTRKVTSIEPEAMTKKLEVVVQARIITRIGCRRMKASPSVSAARSGTLPCAAAAAGRPVPAGSAPASPR